MQKTILTLHTFTGVFQVKHIFRFNLLKYVFHKVAAQPNI